MYQKLSSLASITEFDDNLSETSVDENLTAIINLKLVQLGLLGFIDYAIVI